ncbi:MAG: hypothetical protein LBF92_05585 [Synergistaceae bacterium]|jgi:hypothetical protein|nr:hypothetical protein [Synergistaceae bacterium]
MRQDASARGGTAAKAALIAAVVLAISALLVVYALRDPGVRASVLDWKLDGMKLADYSTDVADLIRDGRYDEAGRLASYVARNPSMPGQETVRDLMEGLGAKSRGGKSPLETGLGFVTGFLSGGGSSTEELFGGLLSNILLNNRGISKSDLPGRADDESEEIASALEEAGLGLSGKWYPSFVRTLHRSGLLSGEFVAFLKEDALASRTAGKPTPRLREAVDGTRGMITAFGVELALGMFPEARDPEDLARMARWGKGSPDETYIVVTHGGVGLLRKLPDSSSGAALLALIAQRGGKAIESANFWLE